MKQASLLTMLVLLLAGCAGRKANGPVNNQPIAPSQSFVLVPLGDAWRPRYVPVIGTGDTITKALADELRRRGFAVAIAEAPTAEAITKATGTGSPLVLCGNFLEWEPDMALALVASDANDVAVSRAHAVIRSPDEPRGDNVQRLAANAVTRLLTVRIPDQIGAWH